MATYNRKELLDLFDKLGVLARYHIEEGRKCVTINDYAEAKHHKEIVTNYLTVREDILKIIMDGSQ